MDENLAKIKNVQMGLNWEANKEEIYWQQHARVNWLQNEDRNMSYFHKVATSHRSKNRITGLEDGNGKWVTDRSGIFKIAVEYFEKLFTALKEGDDERLFGLVQKCVTSNMNKELLKPFTATDIENAVRLMAPLKVPRMDGFPALFFQMAYSEPSNF